VDVRGKRIRRRELFVADAHTPVAAMKATATAITPVAAQPSQRWRRLMVCRPISFLDWPDQHQHHHDRHRDHAVGHRAPDQRAHRVELEDAHRRADAGGGDDDEVEAAGLAKAARQARLPAEQLADRIGRRAGQHRHREQAGADDPHREHGESELARDRSQCLGRLRRRGDVGDAVLVERDRGREHDAKRHEVGKGHADHGVLLDPREVLGDVGRILQEFAPARLAVAVLDLL
jgi:hypothetical protein